MLQNLNHCLRGRVHPGNVLIHRQWRLSFIEWPFFDPEYSSPEFVHLPNNSLIVGEKSRSSHRTQLILSFAYFLAKNKQPTTPTVKTFKTISLLLLLLCSLWIGASAQTISSHMEEVGKTVVFRNTSEGAGAAFWDFGDGTHSSDWHGSHVYQTPGEYLVRLVVENGACSKVNTQSIKVVDPSANGNAFQDLRVYPNPVINQTHLDLPAMFEGEVALTLTDAQGKLILIRTETVKPGEGHLTLDLGHLAGGLYLLNVESGADQATLKIVKQ